MLSNESIQNIAKLLWFEFDHRVDWAEVLGFHGLVDGALSIFEEVGMEVLIEKVGTPGVDISLDLANEIVNELTVLAIKDARRLYIQWNDPEP